MTAAEIFQAMRLADMSKVRERLERLERIAEKTPTGPFAHFLRDLYDIFHKSQRDVPPR